MGVIEILVVRVWSAALLLLGIIFNKLKNNIDAYFALTHFQQDKLKGLLPEDKVWIKSNAINEPINFIPTENKKNYIFVGRLESEKGIKLLLDTWITLPSHFHLEIIGLGDSDLLENTYTRANIKFLGQLPHHEVMQRISSAKYLIHSSLNYETFGLTMVEALSVGTPVIGFEIGTRPEFIQSEYNGFLCHETNLKETILKSYNYRSYVQLSESAINSVKKYYLPQVTAKQVNIYEKLKRAQ